MTAGSTQPKSNAASGRALARAESGPSGSAAAMLCTAGQPMLNVFQRENVENVVCIVTRYFGGILLGAGGLTRAYAKAAKDALDNAGKARMQLFSVLLLECPYPMFERIKLLIEGHEGRIESSDYGAAVTLTFLLPVQKTADFSAALTELSGGQMSAEEVEQRFLPGARE